MEFFNPKSFFLTIAAPSITFLFGGSNSGKTHLLSQLLSQFRSLFDSNVKVVNFVLVYTYYQDYYNDYIDAVKRVFPKVKVRVFKGLTPENVAKLQKVDTWRTKGKNEYSIFILDDVASVISKDIDAFWEGRCHHENISKTRKSDPEIVCLFVFSMLCVVSAVHYQPQDRSQECVLLFHTK